MVLLEAQACGKPVVAGDSGGTAETMRIPQTGRVINCEGPAELSTVLLDLLTDSVRLTRMGEAARRWVVEQFDWTALTRQAAAVFRQGPADPMRRSDEDATASGAPIAADLNGSFGALAPVPRELQS
jgi:glycosyltransferase involved in cell wall biosynthesis